MGGWKTGGTVLGLVGLGFLGWWFLPESKETTARRSEPPVRPGVVGAAFNPPPEPVQIVRPEQPVIRPTAPPATPKRPRASSMSVYVDAEPPARPAPAGNAASGPVPAQTIAGMTVLRAESISDAGWYLMPGDKIQCLNNEPLTERTGARFSATIPEDVRGRDGLNTLIPKGSRAVGKVLRGLDNGERRLAAILTHIEGPSRPGQPTIVVPLGDGQAGDALGGADLEGNIDTHFWSRLGAVAAYAGLDLVGRVGSSVASNAINESLSSRNGTNVNVGQFGMQGGRGLAGRAFDHDIQRPPTFDRPQGQACTVFVNQPIDFRAASRALRRAQ